MKISDFTNFTTKFLAMSVIAFGCILFSSSEARAAGEVSVQRPGESGEYECSGLYEAFSYIASASGNSYEILINDDFTEPGKIGPGDIVVPYTGKKITVNGQGNSISLGSKITLNGNVTFRDVLLKPSKAVAIKLGNNTLTLDNVRLENTIASVAGNGCGTDGTKFKSKLNIIDSDIIISGKLSKVQNVGIEDGSLVSYGTSSYYALTTSGAAILGGCGAFKYNKGGALTSVKGNINILGPVNKKNGTLKLQLYMKTKEGGYELKSDSFDKALKTDETLAKNGILYGKMPMVSSETFDTEEEASGRFVKSAGTLLYGVMPGGYILSYEEDDDIKSSEVTSFAGAVGEINAMKTPRDYKLLVTTAAQEKSVSAPEKLTGPSDKCASMLTITGGDYGASVYYTGKISMKCPVTLDNVEFRLMNKGVAYKESDSPKAVAATFGSVLKITNRGVRFNTPVKLSTKGQIELAGALETITAGQRGVFVGTLSALKLLVTDCALDVIGNISVRNLELMNTDEADAIHLGATGVFNITADLVNNLKEDEGDTVILVTKPKKIDEAKKTVVTPNLLINGSYKADDAAPDIYIGVLESEQYIEGSYRVPKTGDVVFKSKGMRAKDVNNFKLLFEYQGIIAGDQINELTKNEAMVVFAVKDLNVIYPEY